MGASQTSWPLARPPQPPPVTSRDCRPGVSRLKLMRALSQKHWFLRRIRRRARSLRASQQTCSRSATLRRSRLGRVSFELVTVFEVSGWPPTGQRVPSASSPELAAKLATKNERKNLAVSSHLAPIWCPFSPFCQKITGRGWGMEISPELLRHRSIGV